jgi:hypothetical protein
MRKRLFGLALAAGLALATAAVAQPPQTLDLFFAPATFPQLGSELAAAAAKTPAPAPYFEESDHSRRKVTASFTGQSRPLDKTEAGFIQAYADHMHKPQYAKPYERAYLFQEGGKDYWLPVQAPVADFFAKELKPGDQVRLYLLQSGGARPSGAWQWIYLVEEFRGPGK